MSGAEAERASQGRRAAFVGILANALLFAGKLAAGTLAHSVSLAADAFNNLSDALSCCVSLLGFALASRPADEEHPYGHARYEYLAALVASALILAVGFEMLARAFERLTHPVPAAWTALTLSAALISIAVKLALCLYDHRMAKRLDSGSLRAAAVDSLSDAAATLAVLAGVLFTRLTGIEMDGALGLVIAGLILFEGVSLLREAISPLLGRAPDGKDVEELRTLILAQPGVLGAHDLMLHDYGPGHAIATAHVELPETLSAREGHTILDAIEREAKDRLHVLLTLHLDPVTGGDAHRERVLEAIREAADTVDSRITLHDLQLEAHEGKTLARVDCAVPYDLPMQEQEIEVRIRREAERRLGEGYRVLPTVEHSWTGH